MTQEDLILERLDRIEAKLAPFSGSMESIRELKEDMSPLAHKAFQVMVKELEDVDTSFKIEDLLELVKRLLKSSRSITYSLNQLENVIDFITTLEPLLKSSVPQLIDYLDELEQRGVFKILLATLEIRAKVAKVYTAEDIDRIGDGLVSLLALAQKLSEPQTIAFLEKLTEMPSKLDFEKCKDIGPFGLLWASGNKEVKEGLGVLMEFTKGMGSLKQQAD